MSDLIRRQAAIEAIKKDMYADKDYMSAIICEGIENVLNSLPSEPERKTGRWIPCSERLPEEGREVLITAWRDTVMIAWLDDGEWTNDAVTFTDSSKVNAWMPLPEPYSTPDIPGFEGTLDQLEGLHV